MNSNTKRWLISSLVSFLTGFCLVFVMQIDSITLESFKDGSAVGILFVATRAGVKAMVEAFIAWKSRQ